MKICYLDAFSGISGDMTVGALIDAGASAKTLVQSLEELGTGARFEVEKTKRRGIAASKFRVIGGDGKTHRHLKHILEIIAQSGISERAKQNASAVFQRLATPRPRFMTFPSTRFISMKWARWIPSATSSERALALICSTSARCTARR